MAPRKRMRPDASSGEESDHDEVEFTQPGSIVRLKFINFMQYTETEFHCGPNLNTIIGPNGSGKSSIVNGICLGLAGKPSVLNRANSLGEFVRLGAEMASIEVELFHPAEGNLIVFRQFDRTNKSIWKLNGQKSGLREVERKVAELRIQVDNLCQFLPQDRIHEFSTLNNKGLLDSTVDAVGDLELKTKHSELKQLQKTMNEGMDLYDRKKQMLGEKVEQCRRLEEDVKAFEEKKDIEAKIEIAGGKLVWSKYWEVRKVTREVSAKFKEAEDIYKKEKSKLQPIESSVATVSRKKEQLLRKKQSLSNSHREQLSRSRAQSGNIEAIDEKIRDTVDQMDNLERVEEAKKEDIRKLKTVIEEMEQEVASSQDDANLAPQLESAKRKTREVEAELFSVGADSDNLKYENNRLSSEYNYLEQELAKLSNMEAMKVSKLKNIGGDDCTKALGWLRSNQQVFRGAVYEPFIISSNIKNPAQSKYVENAVQRRDLTAFLFEDAEDMNHFLNTTRNTLGLKRVAAVQVPRESLQEFIPNINGKDLRKFGFVSYVKDLISAPDKVVSYMCKQYGLHRIPVFSGEAERHHAKIVEMGITKFFVGDKIHSISGSRYSSAKTTLTREVKPQGQLEISKDVAREGAIKEDMDKIKGKAEELARQSEDYQAKIQSLQISLETARKNEVILQRRRDYKKVQGAKIEAQKKLLRQKLSEQNSNDMRPALQDKIRNLISQQVASTKQLQALVSENSQLKVEMEICSINLQPLDELIQRKQLEMSQAEESLKELKSAVTDRKEEMDESMETMKAVLRQAWDETGKNSKKNDEPPQAVEKEWEEKEIPSGVELIETLMTELQAKADCMDNIDKRTVREYRELKETIKELDEDIKRRDAAMGESEEKMTLLKNSWLEALEALIEKINTSFSSYFSSMGYAGEVGLMKGSHENDFENYGISIRVKFRDSEPLQELTGSRQSGGERSVSTALYMLALQEITSVPFRCVDEINQGMDARNERLVFNLLVRTSCHQTSSQYFLLTPKLLTGLDYSPRMNVLVVYNGKAMCSYRSWDMERFQNMLQFEES